MISNAMFAQIIGESVPPKLIDIVVDKMIHIKDIQNVFTLGVK